MRRHIVFAIFSAALAAASLPAVAQNLDPTVEVTTAYQAKQVEVTKPMLEMAVPDTVMRFAIDFDYSVTSSTYKGSYNFEPYVLDARPEVKYARDKAFYLRAGAGYSLHPTLDFAISPRMKSKSFAMSIYGTHRSYFGKYRSLAGEADGERTEIKWDDGDKPEYKGYNSYTDVGIYGRSDWQKGYFSFDVGYTGYARKDTTLRRGFDTGRVELKFASHNSDAKYFFYDITMAYMYGEDKVKQRGELAPVACSDEKTYLTEHDVTFLASLGSVFSSSEKFIVDLGVEYTKYGSYFDSSSGKFSARPKYSVRSGRWLLDLGAEFTWLLRDDNTLWPETYASASNHQRKSQSVYPDVEIGVDLVTDYLNMYLKATGGDDINRYSSMVARNPWLSLNFAQNYAGMPLIDNTIERFNARLGFRGNISSRFTYDLRGGYARYSGMMLDAVVVDGASMLPTVSYSYCNYWYGALDLGWHSQDVTATASFAYNGTDIVDEERIGFEMSPFTAGFDIVYNWNRRIYFGLHGEGATAREGYSAVMGPADSASASDSADSQSAASLTRGDLLRIPGYFDLGLSAEYRFNHKVSFWVYGSNLLNQTIQRSPLYATSGIAATAGISLNF